MRRRFALFTLVAATVAASPAEAQPTVTLNLDPAVANQLAGDLGVPVAQLQQLVDEEVRALYGLVDVPTFLRLSANAQSMSNKGLGVDYASNVDGLVFGVAFSVAADAGDADIRDVRAFADGDTSRAVPVGTGAQIAVMLGYTVTDDLTLYVNGLYYPLESDQLDGTFYNLGAHAQYKVVSPIGLSAVFQWGGLDLTTGLEVSRMFLELGDTYEARGALGGGFDLVTNSRGTLELEQRALTIPVEATSNLTLLSFLTLYGGVGVDFQLGDASMNFDLTSDLAATSANTAEPLDLGEATIVSRDDNGPDPVMFRVLGGVQLNIWMVKLFGQVNFLTSDLTVSVAGGVRVVL